LGRRNSTHNTPTNILPFINQSIENEIEIENGFDTDVIFVVNESSNISGFECILEQNGKLTKNGKITIETRPNINGSFGAYYDMFRKYINDYDYFFFCEDDVLIYKENYIKDFIEFCDSDDSVGFVSLAPIHDGKNYAIHSGGGCGLTSKEKFLSANTMNEIDNFNNNGINVPYSNLLLMEVSFTNKFVICGLSLKNHPKFNPLCDNYEKHIGHRNNFKPEYLGMEFIYKVGN
jgi:hypothetical protein